MKKAGHVDDFPYSWSAAGYHPSTVKNKMDPVCAAVPGVQTSNQTYMNVICPVDVASLPEGTLPDLQSTDYAVSLIANLTARPKNSAPFLVAVGYHKPHVSVTTWPFRFLPCWCQLSLLQCTPLSSCEHYASYGARRHPRLRCSDWQ
jgi:hypothetical protein